MPSSLTRPAATASPADVASRLAGRVTALVRCFEAIATQRMLGLPIVHPGLAVEAIGFQAEEIGDDIEACGILVTPWFMNLVWLPLARRDDATGLGLFSDRAIGSRRFAAIGAHEPGLGAYLACSLFSPMFEFADAGAAREIAGAVLQNLRAAGRSGVEPVLARPGRRGFLFGRRGASA